MRPANKIGDGERASSAEATLPAQFLPVLEQLLLGVPDHTACRRLSMSPRTFSRRVAELMGYLGAETRFQAGVEAVLRGWVPPAWDDAPTPTFTATGMPTRQGGDSRSCR